MTKYHEAETDLSGPDLEWMRRECPEYLEATEIQEELATLNDPERLRRLWDSLSAFNFRMGGDYPPIGEWLRDIRTNPNYRDNRVGADGMLRYEFLKMHMPDELDELMETGQIEAHLNKVDLACELAYSTEERKAFITSPSLADPVWTDWMKDRYVDFGFNETPYRQKKLEPYPDFVLTKYGEIELERLRDDPAALRKMIMDGELSAHLMAVQRSKNSREDQWVEAYLARHKDEIPPKDSPEYEGWMNMTRLQAEEAMMYEDDYDEYDEGLVEICEAFFS